MFYTRDDQFHTKLAINARTNWICTELAGLVQFHALDTKFLLKKGKPLIVSGRLRVVLTPNLIRLYMQKVEF